MPKDYAHLFRSTNDNFFSHIANDDGLLTIEHTKARPDGSVHAGAIYALDEQLVKELYQTLHDIIFLDRDIFKQEVSYDGEKNSQDVIDNF